MERLLKSSGGGLDTTNSSILVPLLRSQTPPIVLPASAAPLPPPAAPPPLYALPDLLLFFCLFWPLLVMWLSQNPIAFHQKNKASIWLQTHSLNYNIGRNLDSNSRMQNNNNSQYK